MACLEKKSQKGCAVLLVLMQQTSNILTPKEVLYEASSDSLIYSFLFVYKQRKRAFVSKKIKKTGLFRPSQPLNSLI